MKKSIFTALIILLNFSCSEEKSETKQIEKKDPKNQIEITRYFPETIETITEDTTLQDSIRLVTTIRSSDEDFVKFSWDLNSDTILTDMYRDNLVSLKLTVNDSLVLSTELKKEMLSETMPTEFMKEANIILAWYQSINQESGELKLRMNLCKPETDYCYIYGIYISKKGNLRIEMEDIN